MHPVSHTNTYHDTTDLVNQQMVKNKKKLNNLKTKHNLPGK